MASVPINTLKNGMVIKLNGGPHVIVSTEHVKPGKGPAYLQTKLRRMKGGGIIENRFNSSDKVEVLDLVREPYTYSYDAGDTLILMHRESFEEYPVEKKVLGEKLLYLKSGDEVDLELCEDELLDIKLPKSVTHEITETPPTLKGSTATNQPKPATTETGLVIKVPSFIEVGEVVRIDTETGNYLERAK